MRYFCIAGVFQTKNYNEGEIKLYQNISCGFLHSDSWIKKKRLISSVNYGDDDEKQDIFKLIIIC